MKSTASKPQWLGRRGLKTTLFLLNFVDILVPPLITDAALGLGRVLFGEGHSGIGEDPGM